MRKKEDDGEPRTLCLELLGLRFEERYLNDGRLGAVSFVCLFVCLLSIPPQDSSVVTKACFGWWRVAAMAVAVSACSFLSEV